MVLTDADNLKNIKQLFILDYEPRGEAARRFNTAAQKKEERHL